LRLHRSSCASSSPRSRQSIHVPHVGAIGGVVGFANNRQPYDDVVRMVSHLPRTSSGPTFPPACQGTPLDSGADISERVREPAGRSAGKVRHRPRRYPRKRGHAACPLGGRRGCIPRRRGRRPEDDVADLMVLFQVDGALPHFLRQTSERCRSHECLSLVRLRSCHVSSGTSA
jgi:hypothetical protein